MFCILLQFQTICFCNALNSCFIRNVVVQCEECSTIRNFAAQNLRCAGRRNAPSKALRVFFPLTEVYECIDCIIRLISVAVCIQQCQCCCTFVIGLECNGDTFGIRYIVQVQRDFCIFLFRCYDNLVVLLLVLSAVVVVASDTVVVSVVVVVVSVVVVVVVVSSIFTMMLPST